MKTKKIEFEKETTIILCGTEYIQEANLKNYKIIETLETGYDFSGDFLNKKEQDYCELVSDVAQLTIIQIDSKEKFEIECMRAGAFGLKTIFNIKKIIIESNVDEIQNLHDYQINLIDKENTIIAVLEIRYN